MKKKVGEDSSRLMCEMGGFSEPELVMNGSRHQLLEVKLLQATMRGFTGRDIFHVTSRYVSR